MMIGNTKQQWLVVTQDIQALQFWLIVFCCLLLLLIFLLWINRRRFRRLLQRYFSLKMQLQNSQVQNQAQEQQLELFKERELNVAAELEQARQNIISLSEENAHSLARLTSLNEQAKKEELARKENQQQMENQFSVLAQKIFEEKIQQADSQQKKTLDTSLKPFKEQLGAFQKRVEELYDKDLRDRMSLGGEIAHLKKLNIQISEDAVRLTQALRGQNKIQGNWGEMILEQVLEDSGLRKGHEYDVQTSHKNAEGKRLVPDVIVHLPNEKDIVIDAKVSLLSYERYVSASDDGEREKACKEFLTSLRKHLNDLNSKAYEKLDSVRTLDFVFLFVPIEAAFLLALEHDTELFRTAFNKQVVLVSPTTLFACLRTVEHLWRYEKQNKHAEDIANQAAALHDKLVGFSDSLLQIGQSLNKAVNTHQTALGRFSQGRGSVLDKAKKLKKLGVPAKKKFDREFDTLASITHKDKINKIDANRNKES